MIGDLGETRRGYLSLRSPKEENWMLDLLRDSSPIADGAGV